MFKAIKKNQIETQKKRLAIIMVLKGYEVEKSCLKATKFYKFVHNSKQYNRMLDCNVLQAWSYSSHSI